MKYVTLLFVFVSLLSCSKKDDDTVVLVDHTLQSYIVNRIIETGAVIACAASEENTNAILTFYYPEVGATNVRFYKTENILINPLDFTSYSNLEIASTPFFNGYLGKFKTNNSLDHFIIVTYELNNEIKISNPIRTKQSNKPTLWTNEITINQDESLMPKFTWQNNQLGDNAIYFQVLSSENDDLISGTYTTENEFQFYKLNNVVLNITNEIQPELLLNNVYNFTLMDVSEDNWVNLVHQKTFTAL